VHAREIALPGGGVAAELGPDVVAPAKREAA
jgi:hypothetical protein